MVLYKCHVHYFVWREYPLEPWLDTCTDCSWHTCAKVHSENKNNNNLNPSWLVETSDNWKQQQLNQVDLCNNWSTNLNQSVAEEKKSRTVGNQLTYVFFKGHIQDPSKMFSVCM